MRARSSEDMEYGANDAEGFRFYDASGAQGFRYTYGTNFSDSFSRIFSEVFGVPSLNSHLHGIGCHDF